MYTTIIFDFFDVIHVDPFKAWLKKNNISNREPYLGVMQELDRGRMSQASLFEKFHQMSGRPVEEIMEDFANKPLLDPDMPGFIKQLGENYKLGLMSNAGVEEIRPVIKKHGYEALFDYVMVSSEHGIIKPEPEAFSVLMRALDSEPNETIFIDDSPGNAEAARTLGIKSLVFENLTKLKSDLTALGVNVP